MRILHVIHSMDPRSGGPVSSLRGLMAAQVNAGHCVNVLCTDVQSADPWKQRREWLNELYLTEELKDIGLIACRGFGRRGVLRRYRYSRETTSQLKRILTDSGRPVDVVHIHGLFSHVTMKAAALCNRHAMPYVMRPAGGLNEWCIDSKNSVGKTWLYNRVVKRDLCNASFVHATSQSEADELSAQLPLVNVVAIPHGVSFPESLVTTDGERPIILYLSRLHAKKNPDLVLRAFERLLPEHPELRLIMAGSDAGMESECRTMAHRLPGRSVQFVGHVDGKKKAALLRQSRMLVLPSRHENFGVVVTEAMSHGLPVVTTKEVDSSAYVEESGGGCLVARSTDSIAEGMRKMLAIPKAEIGEKGRSFIANNLTWEIVEKRIGSMYRDALG